MLKALPPVEANKLLHKFPGAQRQHRVPDNSLLARELAANIGVGSIGCLDVEYLGNGQGLRRFSRASMSRGKKAAKQNFESALATAALSRKLAADIRGLIKAGRLRAALTRQR